MSGYYDAIEADLERILQRIGELEPEGDEEMRAYIDAGEYGLALETLCAVLKARRQTISAEAYAAISDLAERVGVDSAWWRVLEIS
jgi:hypothetical protein